MLHLGCALLAIALSQAPASSTPASKPIGTNSSTSAKAKPGQTKPPEVHPLPTAEDRLANYTLVLTIFTGVLAAGTLGLWWATRGTVNHLKREFLATHRPRLRIRHVVAIEGDKVTIDLVLANVGDSTATLVEVAAADWDGPSGINRRNVPSRDQIRGTPVALTQRVLKSGQTAYVRYESDLLTSRFSKRAAGKDFIPIMFLCVVSYTDDLGVERKTSTFRILNDSPPITQFVEVKDEPDYNYED